MFFINKRGLDSQAGRRWFDPRLPLFVINHFQPFLKFAVTAFNRVEVNVTGPMFQTLHMMFEAQYTELANAVDLIAERIRALGVTAPGTYSDFAERTSIKEERGAPSAEQMIRQLVEGQEATVRTARSVFPLAERTNDQATADLLTQRLQVHEKTAWMLRSLVD